MPHSNTRIQYVVGGGNTSQALIQVLRNKANKYFTQLTHIEKKAKFYPAPFKSKVAFCNCDSPEESNFWVNFRDRFEHLGLKKHICPHFEEEQQCYKMKLTSTMFKNIEFRYGNFMPPIAEEW